MFFSPSDQKLLGKKVQPNLWPRANSNLVLFSLTEPQNKRTPDLPEEEFEKEEMKENEAAVKKMLVEASREFEEIVVCWLEIIFSLRLFSSFESGHPICPFYTPEAHKGKRVQDGGGRWKVGPTQAPGT